MGQKMVRLVQIDGKLPNLALMKLSHWYKSQGVGVEFTRRVAPDLFTSPTMVYASTIFSFSKPKLDRFLEQFPEACIGGTGSSNWETIEEIIGEEYEHYDYGIYPGYAPSLGFSQRGCRLRCGFCVVPRKEGRPRPVNTIHEIWRGEPHPRQIVLLDNDFFGQPPEEWRARVQELKEGNFKVSFNQGLNVRLIHEEGAHALATLRYYDDQFKTRRLYTAWDNLKDEKIFFRGIRMLTAAGINPRHIMVYMLVGYDPEETWERIFYRFEKMKATGLMVYPMVYNNSNKDLKRFQRWVIRRYHEFIPWEKYGQNRSLPPQPTFI